MKQTDNNLHTQVLLLAMKALDVITKTLDIIAASDAAADAAASYAVTADAAGDDDAVTAPSPTAAATAVGGFPADTEFPSATPPAQSPTTPPKPSKPSTPDTYRADAVRFNEQFLRDHYDLRYNTMKKTTEFRPKPMETPEVPNDQTTNPPNDQTANPLYSFLINYSN